MRTRLYFSSAASLWVGIVLFTGCGGGAPSVLLPSFDPESSGKRALESHDADGDGFLSEGELDGLPGLKAALVTVDTNQDSKVSAEEIAERIRVWETMEIGLMSVACDIYLDGQRLEGATVTFEPEEFLGGAISTAIGETGMGGIARPKVPKENRPSPDSPPGIQAGFYKVKISKQQGGKELIPARYNEATLLGQQISKDDPAIVNKNMAFRMKSK